MTFLFKTRIFHHFLTLNLFTIHCVHAWCYRTPFYSISGSTVRSLFCCFALLPCIFCLSILSQVQNRFIPVKKTSSLITFLISNTHPKPNCLYFQNRISFVCRWGHYRLISSLLFHMCFFMLCLLASFDFMNLICKTSTPPKTIAFATNALPW